MNLGASFVKIPIFLIFLCFPLAQERLVVFGIPLYLLEILVLISALAFLLRARKGMITVKRIPKLVVCGAALLLSGATIALLVNGMDRQELGAFKSWIFFPMVFAFLMAQVDPDPREKRMALLLWFSGVFLASLAALLIPVFSAETYDGRLRSFFPSPNHLAMFLVPGAIIGSFLLRDMASFRESKRRDGFLLIVFALSMIVIALIRTESFGGLMAFVAATAIFFAVAYLHPITLRRVAPPFLLASVVTFGYAAVAVDWNTLASGEVRTSLGSRVMIWNASLDLIAKHPIAGIGMRDFEEHYLALQPFFPPYLEWAVPHPHNVFLAFLLFTGVAGFSGFLMIFFFVLSSAWRRLSSEAEMEERHFHGLVLALFLAFLIQGLVDTPYFRNDLSFFFWAIVALAVSGNKDTRLSSSKFRVPDIR